MAIDFAWQTAIELAKNAEDITYEEWCSLYVSKKYPTTEQINVASMTAKNILVRNDVIAPNVIIDQTIKEYQNGRSR